MVGGGGCRGKNINKDRETVPGASDGTGSRDAFNGDANLQRVAQLT